MLVVLEDLFTQLVHQLVKTQVHLKRVKSEDDNEWEDPEVTGKLFSVPLDIISYLSFNLVVQELFLEVVQSIVGTVAVKVQRVQDVPAREGRIML